jgi:hypothetical protein
MAHFPHIVSNGAKAVVLAVVALLSEASTGVSAEKVAVRDLEPNNTSSDGVPKVIHPVDPRVALGRFGIGINSPGVGVRVLIDSRWMVEVKGQYEKVAQAVGGRMYRYVLPSGRVYPYLGVEGDYLIAGAADGYAAEGFAGMEYFIFRKLSVQFDFGPAWVELGERAFSADEIRYVVNLGVTYYF